MGRVVANIDESLLQFISGGSDRLAYAMQFIGRELPAPTLDQRLLRTAIAEARAERASDGAVRAAVAVESAGSGIGYLFLDRTRISPAGFSLGEHVFTLSLAPGEEVTLEQKTWTTRQITFEEAIEQERTLELEQSSTLSTEMQTGLTQESELKRSFGVAHSFDAKAGVTIPIEAVPVELNVSNSLKTETSLEQADSTTRTESMKRTHQRTSRVAAKNRSLHKTTFKVSTETGFESTSKRVVRNPNRGSAINLHYFKVMRALAITVERYGVQLCWAPFIKDPGFGVRDRIRKAREDAAAGVSSEVILPPRPLPPTSTGETQSASSAVIDLDSHFGIMNDMRVDVEAAIDIPAGYKWDGASARVELQFTGSRSRNAWIKGQPWVVGSQLKALVHVGIDWTLTEPRGHAEVQFFANFAPSESIDPGALKEYREALAAWEHEVAELQAEARRRAGQQALSDVDRILAELSPVAELIPAVVRSYFDAEVRDDSWEVEHWHRVFDFDTGGYSLYPGTWNDTPLPFPERGAADFVNASWARLFLPIRPGFELLALRFIYGGVIDEPLDPDREAQFAQVLDELNQYRVDHFGSEAGTPTVEPQSGALQERFEVVATWTETLPTDGTHVESVLSATMALDTVTEQALSDEGTLREAVIKDHLGDEKLKSKALELFGKAGTTSINVSTDNR
jgi:hypothetical protein